jgi:hypothetical protein
MMASPKICEYFRELHAEALQGIFVCCLYHRSNWALSDAQAISKSGYDLITVGEMSDTTPEMAMRYINPDDKQLQMVSNLHRVLTFASLGS